jgi:hypothetical protein
MSREIPKSDLPESLRREFVQLGRVTILGQGGEHVVLRVGIPWQERVGKTITRGEDPYVIKVSVLGLTLFNPDTAGKTLDEFMDEQNTAFEAELASREARLEKFKQHFGNHVVDERNSIKTLFIKGTEYMNLFPGREVDPQRGYIVKTFVRDQDIVPELDSESPSYGRRIIPTITIPYAENKELATEDYTYVNRRWVMLEDQDREFDDEDELILSYVQDSPHLDKVLNGIRGDNISFRNTVKDFVTRSVAYSNDTRENLDLVGKNNVVFLDRDEWDYKLIDALNPKAIPIIDLTKEAIQKVSEGITLEDQEIRNLLNGLGYIRTINALAHKFKLSERIRLFDSKDEIPSWVWEKIYTILHESPESGKKAGLN